MKDFKRSGGFGDNKRGGFDRRDSGSRSFSRGGFGGGRDSARPAMHSAVCAECGNSCEIPFKPSGDRPVYCSNCFKNKKEGSASPRSDSRDFSKPRFEASARTSAPISNNAFSGEQFAKLSEKLDKVLNILESIVVEEDDYDAGEEMEIEELPVLVEEKKKSKVTKAAKPVKTAKAVKPAKGKKTTTKAAKPAKKK